VQPRFKEGPMANDDPALLLQRPLFSCSRT
jgi:hypothetical protein